MTRRLIPEEATGWVVRPQADEGTGWFSLRALDGELSTPLFDPHREYPPGHHAHEDHGHPDHASGSWVTCGLAMRPLGLTAVWTHKHATPGTALLLRAARAESEGVWRLDAEHVCEGWPLGPLYVTDTSDLTRLEGRIVGAVPAGPDRYGVLASVSLATVRMVCDGVLGAGCGGTSGGHACGACGGSGWREVPVDRLGFEDVGGDA